MSAHHLSFRLLATAILPLFCAVLNASAEAVVAGVPASQLDDRLKGQVLIEELNCAACHTTGSSLSSASKKAPRLADLASRINHEYTQAFILDPHGTKPGTTMPDLLGNVGVEQRKEIATSLTHFLYSMKQSDFAVQAPDAVAAKLGKTLFHSRGCAACHSPRDEQGKELLPQNSVPLGALDKKYSFKSLTEFLRNPHASRPSGRMPDMQLQGKDLERIAHFLLQDTKVPGSMTYTLYRGQVWEGLASDKVTAERAGHVADFSLESLGKIQHQTAIRYEGWLNAAKAGSHTFFLTMNGGSLSIDGKEIITLEPSNRREPKQMQGSAELTSGWHRLQVTYFHTGREPKFSCEMSGPDFKRQPIPSTMLSVSDQPIPALEPLLVDEKLAATGRQHFATMGCANCHDDMKVPAQPATSLAKLNATRGCLSAAIGAWPKFDLTAVQRNQITLALPQAEKPQLTDQQRVDTTLVKLNCIACHERAGLGGISPERNPLFTGTQPSLGDQGRLPPPLSHVGAKLKPEWIAEVLLHGKRQRDYLDATMPQFGEANVGHLVELFGKVDRLEEAEFPKITNLQESKDAGYQLIGTNGLSCIACHEFNGQKAGEISALDISHVPERLNKNWFNLYMRQPSRFHPTVIMPSYWPDGKSTRPNILGGDTAQQIEALWAYLQDGPRAKKPIGLSRQSNELRVSDVTEMCRGQSSIGYRGIAVGYPERISLAFDSGEMALRQLWKGEFANAELGRFNPRGTDQLTFPPGIPFHRLKSLDDDWPYKSKTNHTFPQDQGYQWRGYHLDPARRPTFLYHYGDIAVQDYFEDTHDKDNNPYFKRTITFTSPNPQQPFYFRAATGKKITKQSEQHFTIDKLNLRLTSDAKGIMREGEQGEILIPITLPQGKSILTLEYQW